MKLKFETENHMKIIAENPDESMKQRFKNSVLQSYHAEAKAFLEEVSVELRRLKPGEKKTVKSKPIEVDIERTIENESTKEGE